MRLDLDRLYERLVSDVDESARASSQELYDEIVRSLNDARRVRGKSSPLPSEVRRWFLDALRSRR